ncbi:abortive infection family protein [Photobacterium sagamiensis]|uniref:abortive infection family protein n=1 Tax=Photobacterium sagamiensis TaxID=2910241 RepID=UPI003D103FB9
MPTHTHAVDSSRLLKALLLLFNNYLCSWVRTCRSLSQFWQYIKKIESYQPRRDFIWAEFNQILSALESSDKNPAADLIAKRLTTINSQYVHDHWTKALERKSNDPEGAITLSRTLLESCCKHILDSKGVEYNPAKIELSELYKMASKELNMAPEQHSEQIFKQISGGCSAIVNGLGSLRNKHGDAHGKSHLSVKPSVRHAELAVNLSGSMALFLIETLEK